MSRWRARRPISDTVDILIPFAANAANWIPQSKILLLGALPALLAVVAVPMLFESPFAANSTLKCYDSAKNYEPCLMRASKSPERFDDRTTELHQPPSWTTSALYQQEAWVTSAVEQPASWTTSAPLARRSNTPEKGGTPEKGSTPEKGRASAACGHRLIPCFFSALGRKLTHIASAAANLGRARPARERL
jgi:hypothetical protein